jgi:hypothetical protein
MVVEGPADRVTEFERRHIVHHPPKEMTRCDGTTFVRKPFRSFEFNTIIPMPDCLDGIEASRLTRDAVEALTGESMAQLLLKQNPRDVRAFFVLADQGGFDAERDSVRVATLQRRLNDMPVDQLEMGMRALAAIEECGYPTWYEWAIAKWGTKWSAYNFSLVDDAPGRFELRFDTAPAWSTPDPVFEELARMHPDLRFTTDSFDESFTVHGQALDGVYTSSDPVCSTKSQTEAVRCLQRRQREGIRSVRQRDQTPARKFLVCRHENGWASVVDGGGGDPPLFSAGIVRVGAEPLYKTRLTASRVYEDLHVAIHASEQLLRTWTNHGRCSASCREWMEIEVP